MNATEEILDFSLCTLDLVEGGKLVVKATSRGLPLGASQESSLEEGLAGKTCQTGRTHIFGSLGDAAEARPTREEFRSEISAPISALGVFKVASTKPNAFRDEDARLLELLLGHTAEALKRIRLQAELKEQAIRDPLTLVYNRRHFSEIIEQEVSRSKRCNHPLALVMIDVDRLKDINDRFGHQAGDRVLQEVARLLESQVRATDIVVRYEGDEFLVILPETDGKAETVAERIRIAAQRLHEERPIPERTLPSPWLSGRAPGIRTLLDLSKPSSPTSTCGCTKTRRDTGQPASHFGRLVPGPLPQYHGRMRIGVVQTSPAFGDTEGNLERVRALIPPAKADLWVLPELFATGYQFASREEVVSFAQPVPGGRTTQALVDLAQELDSTLVAGLAERAGERLYNSAVLVGPSGFVTCYRKAHLFFEEKRWFSAGDTPFPVVRVGPANVGILVCFDHLFPEAARTLALRGADVIAHPANLVIPEIGQLTMRVRAIENGVFTATANRVGIEARTGETLRFTGRSQIVSPRGEVLARSPIEGEDVRAAEIDLEAARDKSLNPYNDRLADRRPELYAL